MIKKLIRKFGYISQTDCFKMMHVDGKGFLEATKSGRCSLLHMLIAWHIFEAVIELLEANGEQFTEQFTEENTPYILWRNQGIIDPPLAFSLLIAYIVNHPDEGHLSLFNLAIRCVKASEFKKPE